MMSLTRSGVSPQPVAPTLTRTAPIYFFGRETIVSELLERLRTSRSVFITGPSGSGKSSIARAGVLHALKNEALPDGAR